MLLFLMHSRRNLLKVRGAIDIIGFKMPAKIVDHSLIWF